MSTQFYQGMSTVLHKIDYQQVNNATAKIKQSYSSSEINVICLHSKYFHSPQLTSLPNYWWVSVNGLSQWSTTRTFSECKSNGKIVKLFSYTCYRSLISFKRFWKIQMCLHSKEFPTSEQCWKQYINSMERSFWRRGTQE